MLEKEVKSDIQQRQYQKNWQRNIFEHSPHGPKSYTGWRDALPHYFFRIVMTFDHAAIIAGATQHA